MHEQRLIQSQYSAHLSGCPIPVPGGRQGSGGVAQTLRLAHPISRHFPKPSCCGVVLESFRWRTAQHLRNNFFISPPAALFCIVNMRSTCNATPYHIPEDALPLQLVCLTLTAPRRSAADASPSSSCSSRRKPATSAAASAAAPASPVAAARCANAANALAWYYSLISQRGRKAAYGVAHKAGNRRNTEQAKQERDPSGKIQFWRGDGYEMSTCAFLSPAARWSSSAYPEVRSISRMNNGMNFLSIIFLRRDGNYDACPFTDSAGSGSTHRLLARNPLEHTPGGGSRRQFAGRPTARAPSQAAEPRLPSTHPDSHHAATPNQFIHLTRTAQPTAQTAQAGGTCVAMGSTK
jgi:hypothetical protein